MYDYINPLETGECCDNFSSCFIYFSNLNWTRVIVLTIYVHSFLLHVPSASYNNAVILPQYFLNIGKRMLQSFQKILNKCFFYVLHLVMCFKPRYTCRKRIPTLKYTVSICFIIIQFNYLFIVSLGINILVEIK